jgi:Cu+-exporting ATPase
VIALVILGKYLESGSKDRTSDAIKKLTQLAPDKAGHRKRRGPAGVLTAELAVNDIVICASRRAAFPCDG